MKSAEIIGKNIQEIRIQKGVKQEVLAKHLGIGKSRMSQIESGNCEELSIKKLDKIAAYLQTDFFSITGNNPQNVHINNSTNCSGFNGTHNNITSEIITLLVDEIAKRMSK
jgi:transcriptional regulator with XRE-family HTH domain